MSEEDGLNRLKYLVPGPVRSWLRERVGEAEKGLLVFDRVSDWSVLRRVHPYRPDFGRGRGTCIDRCYIEKFLASFSEIDPGVVAEIGSDEYTKQFGGGRIAHSDILDVNERNERRTITIDLSHATSAPENGYDCILCTQTLFLIPDYQSAIRTLNKMLKPGGVALVTVPGISPIVRGNLLAGAGEDWWRFTARSARRAFMEIFGNENVAVQSYGNVLTATAFLHGLVQEELNLAELEHHDPDYEVIIGIRAMK